MLVHSLWIRQYSVIVFRGIGYRNCRTECSEIGKLIQVIKSDTKCLGTAHRKTRHGDAPEGNTASRTQRVVAAAELPDDLVVDVGHRAQAGQQSVGRVAGAIAEVVDHHAAQGGPA